MISQFLFGINCFRGLPLCIVKTYITKNKDGAEKHLSLGESQTLECRKTRGNTEFVTKAAVSQL